MQNNLKRFRDLKKISQTELAYKVGISQRYVAFLESGDRTPSLSLAMKIAKVLDRPVEAIFLP